MTLNMTLTLEKPHPDQFQLHIECRFEEGYETNSELQSECKYLDF